MNNYGWSPTYSPETYNTNTQKSNYKYTNIHTNTYIQTHKHKSTHIQSHNFNILLFHTEKPEASVSCLGKAREQKCQILRVTLLGDVCYPLTKMTYMLARPVK